MASKKIPKSYIIGLIILLVALAAVFALLYIPMLKKSTKMKSDLALEEEKLRRVQTKVKALMKLRNEVDNLNRELEVLNNSVPKDPDVPGLIRYIETFGEESGITVKRVTIDPNATPNGNIQVNHCIVHIQGEFSQTTGFLSKLKKSPRLFAIKSIKFTPDNNENGEKLDLELKIDYFNYLNSPAATKTANKEGGVENG